MADLKSIQAQLKSRTERIAPATAEIAANTDTPAARATATTARAASREGKVHVGAYLPAGFKSSLRLVQAQTGEDTQTLIARALNDLFSAHKVPVIDHK